MQRETGPLFCTVAAGHAVPVASEVVFWCGLVIGMFGSGLASLRRLNDPDEPIFPRGFPSWSHARVALPWLVVAAALVAVAGGLRLTGR